MASSAISSICSLSAIGMSTGFTTSSADVGDQGAAVGRDRRRGSVRVVDARRRAAARRASASSACDGRLGWRVDAAVGADDDVDGVAGLGREALLEQLLRLAGVRAGRGVVGGERRRRTTAAGQRDQQERRDPGQHRAAAPAVG